MGGKSAVDSWPEDTREQNENGCLNNQMILDSDFADSICRRVRTCESCLDLDKPGALCINDKEIGLSYMYPKNTPIYIMFIAESPPKPGNGFFYDEQTKFPRFKNKLFKLINSAKLGPIYSLKEFTDKGYYLTDAINCRWNKDIKKNLSIKVFRNCSVFLEDQIKLFEPRFIVAMGNKAKQALAYDKITKTIDKLRIPTKNIIKISFILLASNETDKVRIEKLKNVVI